ncbi:DUF6907 domain-containing protein [Micromonospora sp. NBC_01813]|uniref:DUF6907 domain-containing protein n=1 Tax=Micromonospora sp. NBC_01813 TaxID=2975988 RepID=UPI002DDBFBBA|nr:hypothetical protein [Micromonospora sp. NBC_01813]WSA06954.1 hypothetical protein OG958_22170 [Micromonospora sp. NBC_01813]
MNDRQPGHTVKRSPALPTCPPWCTTCSVEEDVPGTRHHRGTTALVDAHDGGDNVQLAVWPDYFDMPASRRAGPSVLDEPHVRVELRSLDPEIALTPEQARALARQLSAAADAVDATPDTRAALTPGDR